MERTLVLLKPDTVKRNLVGQVTSYFEKAGLKVVAMKMMNAEGEIVSKHYVEDPEYMKSIGEKAAANGVEVSDPTEYGRGVVIGLREYLTSGPIVAMVLKGEDAVALVRKVTGATNPPRAEEGTVRRDFGDDSFDAANAENRPVQNLVHASGTLEEAEKEIALWFPEI